MAETRLTPAVQALEERLGYAFKDPALLQSALTHPSAKKPTKPSARKTSPAPGSAYERLEFLGDRVLALTIAEKLLVLHPEASEGELARQLANIVKRESLLQVAENLQLLSAITLGKNERAETRGQANILADATEALLGAIYLDGGLKAAQKFIASFFGAFLTPEYNNARDPKTALQEWAQARRLPVPQYEVIEKSGPAHAPVFVISVKVGREQAMQAQSAKAKGASKQAAEKMAAAVLLAHLTKGSE